jgi:spermidine/putrescine transport system substrate-binding protein
MMVVTLGMRAAAFVSVAVAALSTLPAVAQQELNALVWCDHTDPALLEPFEKKFDVKINTKDYEGTGTALALIEQSRPGDWEMYAAPEKFGYNTLAYNKAKVDPADMRKTSVLWDPKYKGKIAVYDYYIPLMGMVAIGLGMKPSDISEATLPQIREKLFEIKDNAALVGDVVTSQTALATGQVDLIAGGGEYVTAGLHQENPDLDWVLPDDGGVRWMQAIGVFASSERKELATEFVKYILSPEGQARLATSSCYWAMPANTKAALSDEEKAVLRWAEQPGFIAKSYPYFIPDAELDAKMLEVWTEFLQH